MSEIRPSNVRTRAIGEYDALRRTADELDHVALRLFADGIAAIDEALAVAAKLFAQLSAYVDLQELFVLPTVRRVDVWGEIRADLLARAHENLRDELGEIERVHSGPPADRRFCDAGSLAAELREFARRLRAELEQEQRDVLGADALRDDVVDTEPD